MRTKHEIIMELGNLVQELDKLGLVESAEMVQNRPLKQVYKSINSPPDFVPDGPETLDIKVVFKGKP